jgi:quinol monooxygenase YgiN
MIMTWVQLRVQPQKESEALFAIDQLVARMCASRGCGRGRLLEDAADPYAFFIIGEWECEADVDAFLASRDFQVFKGIRILLRGQPVVTIDAVQHRVTRLVTQ